MNKNIIIALLVLITLSSLGFGYYQKIRAEQMAVLTEQQEKMLIELELQAREAQMMAEKQRLIAQEVKDRWAAAENELQLAKKGKK